MNNGQNINDKNTQSRIHLICFQLCLINGKRFFHRPYSIYFRQILKKEISIYRYLSLLSKNKIMRHLNHILDLHSWSSKRKMIPAVPQWMLTTLNLTVRNYSQLKWNQLQRLHPVIVSNDCSMSLKHVSLYFLIKYKQANENSKHLDILISK